MTRTRDTATRIPSDAVLDDRRQRYSAHMPLDPLRRTRVPAALAQQPEFVALAAERQATLDAETRLAGEHAAWQARVQQARAEHREAVRDAALRGTEPPGALRLEVWSHSEHPRSIFDEVHRVIEATEMGVLTEQAPRWARELDHQAAPIRDALGEARAVVRGLEADLQTYDAARDALDRLTASGGLTRRDRDRQHVPTADERADYQRRMEGGGEAARLQAMLAEANSSRGRGRNGPR